MNRTSDVLSGYRSPFSADTSFHSPIWSAFHASDVAAFSRVLWQYRSCLKRARFQTTLLFWAGFAAWGLVLWGLGAVAGMLNLHVWVVVLCLVGLTFLGKAHDVLSRQLNPMSLEARMRDLNRLEVKAHLQQLVERQPFECSVFDRCDLFGAELLSAKWGGRGGSFDVELGYRDRFGRRWEVHYMWWEARHHLVVLPCSSPGVQQPDQAA